MTTMKAFLATLLIVGLAAALPSPKSIIKNLKTQLQQDVHEIKTQTKQLAEQVSKHAKEVSEAVSKDPLLGMKMLNNDLSEDIKKVIEITFADADKVNEQLQSALNDLSKVDAAPLKEIIQNLLQQLEGDASDVQATIVELVWQAHDHLVDDAKAAIFQPETAAKLIKDNLNMDYQQFVGETKKYATTIQQQLQEAIEKLNQQLDQ